MGLGGQDTLIGGVGADSFRFLVPSDSAVGANRDVIQAFSPAGGDRIDLSAIDANGALAGGGGLRLPRHRRLHRGGGPAALCRGGPDVILQGTIAGGAPAFEIRLAGIGALAAGDLLL